MQMVSAPYWLLWRVYLKKHTKFLVSLCCWGYIPILTPTPKGKILYNSISRGRVQLFPMEGFSWRGFEANSTNLPIHDLSSLCLHSDGFSLFVFVPFLVFSLLFTRFKATAHIYGFWTGDWLSKKFWNYLTCIWQIMQMLAPARVQ